MLKLLVVCLFIVGCTTPKKTEKPVAETTPPKEFAPGEIILATELLTRIFDQEMAPLKCVADTEEASLLLRTIRPRMDVVQDDMEAKLDDPKEVSELINTCDQNCTCGYVDELLREHLVPLTKAQKKILFAKRSEKELNRCMNYVQNTFCQSELYKTLNVEKADFTFEEGI